MARIRTIKPEFPQSESMGRVSREARLCFVLLWTIADDSGRLRGNSRMLASLLYPYDNDAGKLIDRWLIELEQESCIDRYEVVGDRYIQIRKWLNHQKIDRPSVSKIPAFDESSRVSDEDSRGLVMGSKDLRIKEGKGRDQGSEDLSLSGEPDVCGDIEKVFQHWQEVHDHPRATLDAKRRRLIGAALKGYSEADLCRAISGYKNSPHHMGKNDRDTVYDDIGLLLKDSQHIDAGIRFYEMPPRVGLSKQTREIIDNTAGWVPPELRVVP